MSVRLLQPLPPNLSSLLHSKTRPRPRVPLSPAHNSITTPPPRKSTPFIVSAAANSRTTRNEDDYHSTLTSLNSKGRFPRKSLGQHYMLNSSINEQLAGVADVKEGDVVLEIGPGMGSLTNVLANAGATVLAIEKDPHMAALVTERFESIDRVKIYTYVWKIFLRTLLAAKMRIGLQPNMFCRTMQVLQEDFTKCHIHSHLISLWGCQKSLDGESRYAKVRTLTHLYTFLCCVTALSWPHLKFNNHWVIEAILVTDNKRHFVVWNDVKIAILSVKVVSNIPFNITTDVVKLLLPMGDIFSDVVLLLQEETALRLVDSSLRTSEYRPINIFINFYSDPEYMFKVPRSNFFPQPNVDAAVVTFRLKQTADYPSVSSTKSFFSMVIPDLYCVNSAFNGKRKMLRRSLQHICTSPEIEAALENVGLPATSRPEELTLDNFVKLHNLVTKT
ncbi:hypothetical protein RHSIM_Rhsim01G0155600 [Rhododendron simsii]|uniref:rRNA adenine N(6)-methyltransferase n=1 Tax=Rhododendron simsii TaxID=118357 RepID=A0A834HHF1_RHOSS|nr:hypothetical protein RHSIM_Rhsim01G0155600 [Rhododendron simsii]